MDYGKLIRESLLTTETYNADSRLFYFSIDKIFTKEAGEEKLDMFLYVCIYVDKNKYT